MGGGVGGRQVRLGRRAGVDGGVLGSDTEEAVAAVAALARWGGSGAEGADGQWGRE